MSHRATAHEGNPTHPQFRRREFFALAGGTLAAAAIGGVRLVPGDLAEAAGPPSAVNRKRTLRLAHMTDIHVQSELAADQGMTASLRHVQSLKDKPQMIFFGGDAVMESLAASAARVKQLWDVWHRVLKSECSLPVQYCLGNHDIWGWDKAKSKTTGAEPGWGKQRGLDELGLKSSYYSFERGGWHFIVLDSMIPDPHYVYHARLDEGQFHWLEAELKRVPAAMPVALVSHIPIVSVAVAEFGKENETLPQKSGMLVHTDGLRILRLLKKHPNVKLALSGHLHLTERIEYAGVTYLCSGSVCGAWWRGPRLQVPEGYMLVDFYDDGSFEQQYVAYGWKARKA